MRNSQHVPKGMSHQIIALTWDGSALTAGGKTSVTIEAADVIFFKVTNTGPGTGPVGFFGLHKGVKASAFSPQKADELGAIFSGSEVGSTGVQGFVGVGAGTYVLAATTETANAFAPNPSVKPIVLTVSASKATSTAASTPAAVSASPVASPTP